MRSNVKSIDPDMELLKAKKMIEKYQISEIPVAADDKLVGI